MIKFIKNIIFVAIIVLACFGIYQGVLEHFAFDTDSINYELYEKLYYYNQLTDEQKEIYIKLDNGINELKPTIHLGFFESLEDKIEVERALEAIYKDRPEYYFLPQEYYVGSISCFNRIYVYMKFEYSVKDLAQKKEKDIQLKSAIDKIVYEAITNDMTEIEMQIALHDKLMSQVEYYSYSDIQAIPYSKHTAYDALVNKEAVCDGISRAMMLLLNEVGIDTIMISGQINNVPHAWNVVKLDGEYYHMDATSNQMEIEGKNYVIHKYFNVTDEEIEQTHLINKNNSVPECTAKKHNYYLYNEFNIDYLDSIRNKIVTIINRQVGKSILELKIDKLYTTRDLLEALYFVDYNNWHTESKTSVSYHNLGDVYIFENNMTRPINY